MYVRNRVCGIAGLRCASALAALLLGAYPLAAAELSPGTTKVITAPREVTVTNDLNETIYGLYLWPSDLVPRTYSVLMTPLMPNRDATVRVDNVYGDCEFTFRADLTVPKGRRKVTVRQYRKPRPRNVYVYNIDLCQKKGPIKIADPVGSNYGP